MNRNEEIEAQGKTIDWTTLTVSTLGCRCGNQYRGRAKALYEIGIIPQKPCPSCGRYDGITRISMDPETGTITRGR